MSGHAAVNVTQRKLGYLQVWEWLLGNPETLEEAVGVGEGGRPISHPGLLLAKASFMRPLWWRALGDHVTLMWEEPWQGC